MSVRLLGRFMDVSFEQDEKAIAPILVTLLPTVTVSSAKQEENAKSTDE